MDTFTNDKNESQNNDEHERRKNIQSVIKLTNDEQHRRMMLDQRSDVHESLVRKENQKKASLMIEVERKRRVDTFTKDKNESQNIVEHERRKRIIEAKKMVKLEKSRRIHMVKNQEKLSNDKRISERSKMLQIVEQMVETERSRRMSFFADNVDDRNSRLEFANRMINAELERLQRLDRQFQKIEARERFTNYIKSNILYERERESNKWKNGILTIM